MDSQPSSPEEGKQFMGRSSTLRRQAIPSESGEGSRIQEGENVGKSNQVTIW